ncbi:MAG: hypothetical protein LPK09_03300 [Hymenobacteraceae bacterium]|nr:hypothetical protein [Hymenobacteraceae bacterium]
MKSKILLLIATICVMGCNPKEEQEEITSQNSSIREYETTRLDSLGPNSNQTVLTEYIEWSNITINNSLPLEANIRQVEAMFGKADSTSIPDYTNICHNCHFCNEEIQPFKNAYFKGVKFEQLNDSLVFWSADFTVNKSLFLQSGNMRFDYKTTLEEVSNVFPEAVRAKRVEESDTWIRISPSKQPVDGDFILEFNKNGYLTKFHYWFPC